MGKGVVVNVFNLIQLQGPKGSTRQIQLGSELAFVVGSLVSCELAARGRSGSFTPSREDKNLLCGPRVRTRASGGMCFPVLCTSEPRSRAARKPATCPPRAPADRAACPCPAVAASPATG